ncbi:MAG: Alanine--tRNA ligase [Parcubacteria group bacterium Gr01-1014_29]|nr:MAG: Alanine--tRNA ligase [Parcubacteria group bacterium Gr01-1014_29]
MNSSDIRRRFLEFFKSRGHAIVPSSSLVPNDPTTLFTSAGMQPMVPYLLGKKHPSGLRIVNSQRCFRSQDIEEVGDNRHDTFFEMLGNWSFGDYFKKEQLAWMFEFLTKELGLDPYKLYVTVFCGNEIIPRDAESMILWKDLFKSVGIEAKDVEDSEAKGMQGGRIFYYGEKKNWWSREGSPKDMSVGEPGGPDSEMFYEFSDVVHNPTYGPYCHVNCDCGRYMEIGNNVFMEYIKNVDGSFSQLPAKNVDFGGGLERMVAATRNDPDIFNTDLSRPLIEFIEKTAEKKYEGADARSMRIIVDHVKAATMLIADGVLPSNKTQGYILRRLIRRAVRFGRILGIQEHFMEQISKRVSSLYRDVYPELPQKTDHIAMVLRDEETKFSATISRGLKEIEKLTELDGTSAFRLYESYGFPFELTEEIARERGQQIAYGEFKKAFEKHQEISRAGTEKKFGGHGLLLDTGELKAANEEELNTVTRLHTATHLLQAALRKVLGDEVRQMGSDITAERTRFDFSFERKVTKEELEQIEHIVNEVVQRDYTVEAKKMPYEEAIKTGALYVFSAKGGSASGGPKKYPEEVNVYSVYDLKSGEVFSREFCGGPHVKRTGEIGHFRIIKEESSSAGVRRIRGVVEN